MINIIREQMENSAQQSDQLQLMEASLCYLDKTKQLEYLKRECINHNNTEESVYPFTIEVNVSVITEMDPTLGNIVLHQPQQARTIFQELCYISLKCLKVLPAEVSCNQILVNLLILDLPQLSSYQLCTSELLSCKFEPRFYKFTGTVCSISSPTTYSRCAKYRCPEAKCFGAADNFYIRCHIEGAKERQTVRQDFNCVYCGNILKEDVNCRVLGEKQILQIVEGNVSPRNDVDANLGRYSQAVTVVLRDEFFNIQLGGYYCVIGIPVKELAANAAVSVVIEANNVIKVHLGIQREIPSHLPETLSQLLKSQAVSPWGFSTSLAFQFGSDISPPGTYHRLKLCMLLSLIDAASCTSDEHDSPGYLDLVAVGTDTSIIQRLLLYGASFAPRVIIHNSSQPLLVSIRKDPAVLESYTIDAGSVLLARQGVCLLGDLYNHKRETKAKLRDVMSNRVVHVDLPKKLRSSSAQQQLFPVNCNLWCYLSCSTAPDMDHLESLASGFEKRNLKKSILESFSMVLVCDTSNPNWDEWAELSIVRHTLLGAMEDRDQWGSITSVPSPGELRRFLEIASETKVDFSDPAKQLLKGYFLGSRRVRLSGVHGTPFPSTALHTLACMSRAHAKLCLRGTVLKEDAAIAVFLYEEAITARYGFSVLNVHPKANVRHDSTAQCIGPEDTVLTVNKGKDTYGMSDGCTMCILRIRMCYKQAMMPKFQFAERVEWNPKRARTSLRNLDHLYTEGDYSQSYAMDDVLKNMMILSHEGAIVIAQGSPDCWWFTLFITAKEKCIPQNITNKRAVF
ncbi:minichromosome maintenance domain-containing protein 2-like isoform X2 [Asterias amurensis]|uniref:minichromosome maintenance domain-containing protein 2-like isoform X2 n=1 Tax=Asterias amurensis TaxID=7602 RepID=UPI003AB1B207